ncbi:MAG TPA: serine/threonine-protein kinase [Planctomycetota bacterium]
MSPSSQDHASGLPVLPADVHDDLLAILFGDPQQREPGVNRLLAQRPELRERIAAFIAWHDANARDHAEDQQRPQQIGPYRILDTLGEGGMGTVYLAEQQEPVRLRVALKLIKLGMDSKAVVSRFEQERQALAMMQHDGIARVFNCGTSERGQPYFVMELVTGIPLNQFCEAHRLPLPQRLVLMQQVCAAVQHAHQKGVLHRDLKPGNVLVSNEGGKLQIKIIDFGLAKAMGGKLVEATLTTEAGQIVGTPEYMAPEQADPANQDIDTRADIYSLGVMLYELLVGALPFPGHELRKAGMLEVQRILREVDPPKPSTKLKSSVATTSQIASARCMSPSALVKALEHDLNWVALKALEKDRNRRYESATALAADLQRFLDHEPLLAGPPSATYRLRKLMRRHRGQFLAASAVLLALVGGGIGTFVQYVRAEDKAADAVEQQRIAQHHEKLAIQRAEENEKLAEEKTKLAADAQARTKELEQVLSFQEAQWQKVDCERMGAQLRRSLLENAKETDRADLEARLAGMNFTSLALAMLQENLFDRSLAAIGEGFAEQRLVKARLLQSVADTLRELGLFDLATAPQTEALEIRRRDLGDADPDTLSSIRNASLLLEDQGKLAEAESLCREALEGSRRVRGDDHPDTLVSINNLSALLQAQGKLAEAEPLYREALEKRRLILGDEHPDTLGSMNNLGTLLKEQGRLAEAEPLLREVLETNRRLLGDDHASTLISMNSIGWLLQAQGKLEEAERYLREALEKQRLILGDDHRTTLASMSNMGLALGTQGQLEEAEPLLREALERRQRILGNDHQETLNSVSLLSSLLREQGKLAEAEPMCRQVLEQRQRILGDDHPDTLGSIREMAVLLRLQGKRVEAEPYAREALEKCRLIRGGNHPDTLGSIHEMGQLLQAQGKLAEAEPYFREALEKCRLILGNDHPYTLTAINNMGGVLDAQGRFAETEPLFREALEKQRRKLGDDHRSTLSSIYNMGFLLQRQGKLAEAEPLVREALERRRRILGDDHPQTLASISNLGSLLRKQGQFTEAEPLYREALERRRRTLGDDHPDTLGAIGNMGSLLHAQGKLAEAEPHYREALEKRQRILGEDHRETLISTTNLGRLLVEMGRHEEAVALLSPVEAAERRVFVLGNADRLASWLRNLGDALAGLARLQDAEARLLEARSIMASLRGPTHKDTRPFVQSLVRLYEAWHFAEPAGGHDVQAAEWKAKLADEPVKDASK